MTVVPAFITAMVLMVVGHPVPVTCSTALEWASDPVVIRAPFGIDAYTQWPAELGTPAEAIHLGPTTCARHDGVGDLQVLLEAEHARHVYSGTDETDDTCAALGWLRVMLQRDPATYYLSMLYEKQAWGYFLSMPDAVYHAHPCWQ